MTWLCPLGVLTIAVLHKARDYLEQNWGSYPGLLFALLMLISYAYRTSQMGKPRHRALKHLPTVTWLVNRIQVKSQCHHDLACPYVCVWGVGSEELSGEVRTEESIFGPVHVNAVWKVHRCSHTVRSLDVRRECLCGLVGLSVDLHIYDFIK